MKGRSSRGVIHRRVEALDPCVDANLELGLEERVRVGVRERGFSAEANLPPGHPTALGYRTVVIAASVGFASVCEVGVTRDQAAFVGPRVPRQGVTRL